MNWLAFALVIAIVIAIVATVVAAVGATRCHSQLSAANEAISGVCTNLVNAEAAHTLELLRPLVLMNTSLSGYDDQMAVQMIRDYLQKSYWLVETYRGLGARCPQTWADVEARMAQQIQALQAAATTAKSDPAAAMNQLVAAVQAHQSQLIAYFSAVSLQAQHD